MSSEKKVEECGVDDARQNDRHPFTAEHLYVITELAKLGLMHLGLVLPQFEKELDGAGRQKREHYAHLKSLLEVAGPETVRHFDEMCQYLYDKAKGASCASEATPNADK